MVFYCYLSEYRGVAILSGADSSTKFLCSCNSNFSCSVVICKSSENFYLPIYSNLLTQNTDLPSSSSIVTVVVALQRMTYLAVGDEGTAMTLNVSLFSNTVSLIILIQNEVTVSPESNLVVLSRIL